MKKLDKNTKNFGDVARGFHFSAEYRIYSLAEEQSSRADQNSPKPGGRHEARLDPGRLNQANLGFFLAAVSYLYNFKEGTKEQPDLVFASTSVK
jgi:hypothetical protein